jgi:hypothetical protein
MHFQDLAYNGFAEKQNGLIDGCNRKPIKPHYLVEYRKEKPMTLIIIVVVIPP